MECGRGKTRMNVQGDRLSNLPNDIICKILSLVTTKLAVQTSALSPRWRYIWTSLPCLHLSSDDFKTLPKFSNFVTHVLSCRNNQIEVSSAKLSFCEKASQACVKRILDQTFVKQLTVTCRGEFEFPLSLFSSNCLEHLTFVGCPNLYSVILTLTWELTNLTTLHLESITFKDEVTAKDTGIFSKCANLKKLVLKNCGMSRSWSCEHGIETPNDVHICQRRLSSLTLVYGAFFNTNIIVYAPQLKELTVEDWEGLHLISTPNLVSLHFRGEFRSCGRGMMKSGWLTFSSYELNYLEDVDLCIFEYGLEPNKQDAHTIFDILHQRHSVKYLTLNLEIFQLLSPLMELISYEPSPFVNLKSLKVYPHRLHVEVLQTIPAEIKRYLLDGSPSATFTEVSYEEMRVLRKVKSAVRYMAKLRETLEYYSYKANMDRFITPVEWHEPNMHGQDKMQMRDQIDSCWKDISTQIKYGELKTSSIISMLRDTEHLLTALPASKRAKMEKSFSRLCTEADIVMNAIMNSMKIQSDEMQSRLRIYFHELATKVLQTIPAEVKKHLLDGSPSATFTEVSYEEMRALKNAESAPSWMAELMEMLEREKANIETNIDHCDRVMSSVKWHMLSLGAKDWEMRDQIDSCWKDLSAQTEHEKKTTSGIISMLCEIKQFLTELPASRRAPIEKSCSRLCTEANTVMNTIMNSMKIQSDEKQSHLSIYFRELATEFKRCLLDDSFGLFFDAFTEERRALSNAESALAELSHMLENENETIETNIANLDRLMTPMECHKPYIHEQDKMQINDWEMTDQRDDSCWKDLSAQIEHGKSKTSAIISTLCDTEELLTELPASKSAQIETSFSRMCLQADIVMNAIMDSMKIQSDEMQSRLSIYIHELALQQSLSLS